MNDELNVKSSFTNRIISALISKGLEKYFGFKIQVDVSELKAQVSSEDQTLKMRVDADITVNKEVLEKLAWGT